MRPSFQSLRQQPTDLAAWQALCEQYWQNGWPWQAAYCHQQALRIAALRGQPDVSPDMGTLPKTHGATLLMQTMPMEALGRAEMAQAPELAQPLLGAWRDAPDDWLSGLILLRLGDLCPLGDPAPTLAQVQALEWLPGETAHLWAN